MALMAARGGRKRREGRGAVEIGRTWQGGKWLPRSRNPWWFKLHAKTAGMTFLHFSLRLLVHYIPDPWQYAFHVETDRKLFRHNILPNISTEYSAETE